MGVAVGVTSKKLAAYAPPRHKPVINAKPIMTVKPVRAMAIGLRADGKSGSVGGWAALETDLAFAAALALAICTEFNASAWADPPVFGMRAGRLCWAGPCAGALSNTGIVAALGRVPAPVCPPLIAASWATAEARAPAVGYRSIGCLANAFRITGSLARGRLGLAVKMLGTGSTM